MGSAGNPCKQKAIFKAITPLSKLNAMDILPFFVKWIRPTADKLLGVMAGVK
jgi:hypothetical protein